MGLDMMSSHVGKKPLTRFWRNKQTLAEQKQRNLEIEASIVADAQKQRVELDLLLLGSPKLGIHQQSVTI